MARFAAKISMCCSTQSMKAVESLPSSQNKPFLAASSVMKSTSVWSRVAVYLGAWKRSVPYQDDYFAIDNLSEPHFKRRYAILAAHPQIASLYGVEWQTKWILLLCVGIQLLLAYTVGVGKLHDISWYSFATLTFVVGGSVTQILGEVFHECCHNLVCISSFGNKLWALFANIALPVPIGLSFRRYHLVHHAFQGKQVALLYFKAYKFSHWTMCLALNLR